MKRIIIMLSICGFINPMEQNRQPQCTITFKPSNNGLAQITRNILNEIPNPNIVVWYSGENGLTNRSKSFYEKNLITPLKQVNTVPQDRKPFQLYLYDLNAWNILKNEQSKSTQSLETIINNQNYSNTQLLSSKNFFEWLSQLNTRQIDIISNALNRPFIWKTSNEYCNKKTKLNQDPSYGKTLTDTINIKHYSDEFKQYFIKKDNAYIYSALQYLEAFFITQELSQTKGSELCNIAFLLPGDEYTYYTDTTNKSCTALQEDLNIFFKQTSTNMPQQLNLYFYGFKYLHNGCTRPYLKLNDDSLYCNQQKNL